MVYLLHYLRWRSLPLLAVREVQVSNTELLYMYAMYMYLSIVQDFILYTSM